MNQTKRHQYVASFLIATGMLCVASGAATVIKGSSPPPEAQVYQPVPISKVGAGKDVDMALSWLALADADQYDECYKLFRGGASGGFSREISSFRKIVGKPLSRKWINTQSGKYLKSLGDGEYKIFSFMTTFSDWESTQEMVVFSKKEGEWKVVGYFVEIY